MCFRKFLSAAKFYNVDVLILGGDLTGKIVVPIVEQSDGTYTSTFLGRNFTLRTKEDKNLEENISRVGYYPYVAYKSEMEELRSDEKN